MTSVVRSNGQLVFEVFGNGPNILLAFHGFGQDKNIFKSWAEIISKKYTIYSFDLFYHGESHRIPGRLSKEEWNDWIGLFLLQEDIDQFSVLGYSLGGRFALSTAFNQSERIVFKHLMTHPNHLDKLLDFNDRSKMVNRYVADFARKEMGDPANRERVYRSWNHFKTLGYTEKRLIEHFNRAKYEKILILGDRDQIIHPNSILPIINKTKGFEIHRLSMKHHELIKLEVADLLLK